MAFLSFPSLAAAAAPPVSHASVNVEPQAWAEPSPCSSAQSRRAWRLLDSDRQVSAAQS